MKNFAVLTLWLAVLSSCGDGASGGWAGSVDTLPSGAIVVHNDRAASGSARFGRLEEVVRIGAVDGDGPDVFGRIADVEIGPDGNIYVVDRQAAEIRVFDLEGRYIRTIGRKGRGPGEFQAPTSVAFAPSGVLWVVDGQRYTAFEQEGDLLNTYSTVIRSGFAPGQLRLTPNGRLVDLAYLIERQDGPGGSVRMRGLGPGAVAWTFADSAVLVDSVAFGNQWRAPSLTRQQGGETTSMVVPLAPQRTFEISPRGVIWTGIGDEYAAHAVTLEGDTVLTIRRRVAAEPLTAEDIERLGRWLDGMRERGFPEDRSQLPQSYPFFDRIVAADDGTLWIHRNWPGQGAFDVFDEDGRYLGEVQTSLSVGPFGTHPSISREHIVGVALDSLDVPRVEVHRIVRD